MLNSRLWTCTVLYGPLYMTKAESKKKDADQDHQVADIYYNPDQYLTSPANVTGYIEQCDASGQCHRLPNQESFLWFNSLHPSWKTDSIISERFVEVVEGRSKYATYWG